MTFIDWLLEHNGIASIITTCAVLVALIPVFREFFHKFRFRRILREQILLELTYINVSFMLKVKTILKEQENISSQGVRIYDKDKKYFERIGQYFEQATYLRKFELREIGLIIRSFRIGSYTVEPDQYFLSRINFDEIFEHCKSLLSFLQRKVLDLPKITFKVKKQFWRKQNS